MTEKDERVVGVFALHEVKKDLEVIQHVIEGRDVTARARGASVPLMVECMHRHFACSEPCTEAVVAAAVLGEAVGHHHHAVVPGREPGAAEQRLPARSFEA